MVILWLFPGIIVMCLFCLRCYWDSIRSYFICLCLKNLFLHLSLCLCVIAGSAVNTQQSIGCLVLCFHGMTSSLAKSKQIIGCTLSDAFFQFFFYFLMFLNQINLTMSKTDDEQFTLATKKIIALILPLWTPQSPQNTELQQKKMSRKKSQY